MGGTHSSTSMATLQDEIKQRRAEAMEVFAKKDVNGFVAFFTPGATLMFPDSDYIQGEEGIKQRYQKFFDSGAAYIHMEILEVGPMGGDNNMAYDRGYVQVLNAEHSVMINGKYLAIWKKISGKWLVYVDSYNSKP